MSAREVNRLETPIGEMVLFEGDVIVHTIGDGAIVDPDAASGVLEVTRTLAGGREVAVVVDLRAVGFADKTSREMFASDPAGGVEIATALVAGPRVSAFLAELFVRSDPARPTRLFEDVDTAFAWGLEQARTHRSG